MTHKGGIFVADNENKRESFPEKTYKHFITAGILQYPVPHMEMIKNRLKHGAEQNKKDIEKEDHK